MRFIAAFILKAIEDLKDYASNVWHIISSIKNCYIEKCI